MALTIQWSIGPQAVTVDFPQADGPQLIAAMRHYATGQRLGTPEAVAAATAAQLARLVVRHQMAELRRIAVQAEIEIQAEATRAAAESAVGFSTDEESQP